MPMIQYTLRNVPPDIDAYLRREARRLNRSLNRVAIEYLDFGTKESRKIDEMVEDLNKLHSTSWLDEFAQKGTVDKKTVQILVEQEKLDKEQAKRGD